MEILNIYLQEQLLIKYYVIKYLILLKIRDDGYQRGVASIVYSFFVKKTPGGADKNEIVQNKELAEELHKTVARKFEKEKVHSSFIDNIQAADLADMQVLSKFNKTNFLLSVIDFYSKYAWVIPLKGITITNAFQKYQINQVVNQTKYGQIKVVNFTMNQ